MAILRFGFMGLLVSLALAGCGGDSKSAAGDVNDAAGDSSMGDLPDLHVEDAADLAQEVVPDAEPEVVNPLCMYDAVPQDTPDPSQKKFALSMFHFNIQYVAGGLEAETPDGDIELMCGKLCEGWTDAKLHDWYITAVFEPVIDLFLKHPEWRATFEFQGLLLEVMEERHPGALKKLQEAAQKGIIEVVSIHYSDQFFLAFPRFDLQRSADLNRSIFEKSCVPLSGVVFNQEGQAGEGKHRFMKENGYAISVFPSNLWFYYHQEPERALFYKDRGVDVVVGPGKGYRSDLPLVFEKDEATGIEVTWTFFDDGDLLAYPPSPYLAPLYTPAEGKANLAEYEAKLLDLESKGFKVTGIADYVAHLKAQGVAQPDLLPVLDGTWQPIDTDSVHRWLGGRSVSASAPLERDNFIRTNNYVTRTELQATLHLLEKVPQEQAGRASMVEKLEQAYRHLFLAQVSDVTGITPWIGEFYHGIIENRAARELGAEVWEEALEALGSPHASVSLETGEVQLMDALPVYDELPTAEAPFELEIEAETRETTVAWLGWEEHYQLRFTYGPAADPSGLDESKTRVKVGFPRTRTAFMYTPALAEDEVVEYDFNQFTFQYPEVYLPLSNGLIGLGDDWWVIKHCSAVHVAARVPTDPAEGYIQFIDETADPVEPQTWVFTVMKGSKEEALAEARRVNTHTTVTK